MTIESFNAINVPNTVPVLGELAQQINFLINIFVAFGGAVLLFILFTIYKFLTIKKEMKLLKEIKADIKKLNRKVKSK